MPYSVVMLSVVMLSDVMVSVIIATPSKMTVNASAECHYAECRLG
jgi:hypothetical protein